MSRRFPGWVYVVQADGDRVKIGWSANPRQRLKQLENQHGDLYVWACVPGTRVHERWLHDKWRHCWLEGEWFSADSDLLTAAENGRLFQITGGLCTFNAAPGVGVLMAGRPEPVRSEDPLADRETG